MIRLPGTVTIDGEDVPRYRHPHPREVALLTGLHPDIHIGDDMRLALCGVGQLASPLQSAWIYGAIRTTLQQTFCNREPFLAGEPLLNAMIQELVDAAAKLGNPVPSHEPDSEDEFRDIARSIELQPSPKRRRTSTVWVCGVGSSKPTPVTVPEGTVAAHISSAETKVLGAGTTMWSLQDHAEILAGQHVYVTLTQPPPVETLAVAALHVPASEGESESPSDARPAVSPYRVALGSASAVEPAAPTSASHLRDPATATETFAIQSEVPVDVQVQPTTWNFAGGQLTREQAHLCSTPVPKSASAARANELRGVVIRVESRVRMHNEAGPLWADDEMLFHLQRIASVAGQSLHCLVVDPIATTNAAQFEVPALQTWWHEAKPTCGAIIITAAQIQEHWVPIVLRFTSAGVIVHTRVTDPAMLLPIRRLYQQVPVTCQAQMPFQFETRAAPADYHCGARAYQFLCEQVFEHRTDESPAQASCRLKLTFLTTMLSHDDTSKPYIWGGGPTVPVEDLAAILVKHGVSPENSHPRALAAIAAIGHAGIARAIASPQQWRELKALGNQCRPPFLWIQADELQAQIQARAIGGKAIGHKKAKPAKSKAKQAQPVVPDVQQIAIAKGVFFQEPDIPLAQMSIKQIGPCAAGVAVSTCAEAQSYIKAGRTISAQAFGLIVLELPSMLPTDALSIEQVQFPATCTSTGEPIIVTGSIIQLGDRRAVKHVPKQVMGVQVVPSQVVRLVIYRDQAKDPWAEISQKPVRYLMDNLPLLKLCKEVECECPKWHNLKQLPTSDVVLDLWKRQFVGTNGKPAQPHDAQTFLVNLRIPAEILEMLLPASGTAGIYIEPRASDGRGPHPDYQAIWTKATSHEAEIQCQVHLAALGLIRAGDRYGIRVRNGDAEDLHKALKPNVPFVGGQKQVFEAGPFPFGVQREAIQAWISEWKWQARPLHTVSGGADKQGTYWRIQASAPPPASSVQLQHGIVLVHQVADRQTQIPLPGPVVASQRTLRSIQAGEDPLVLNDPWQKARANNQGPAAAASSTTAPSVLAHIDQQVASIVQSHLQQADVDMESHGFQDQIDQTNTKIDYLERKLIDLHQQQQRTTEARFQSVEQQVQSVETAVQSQQSSMQLMFDTQMAKIESLLLQSGRRARSRSRKE